MNSNLQRAVEILDNSRYTCVLCKGEQILTTEKRGVLPLVEWLEAGKDLKGFSAADKVVGKGAAFLYVLAGVKEVYAPVMSEKAAELLARYGIHSFCEQKVEAVRNRQGTGNCPMEEATKDIEKPEEAWDTIKETLKKLTESKKEQTA